MTLIFCPGFKFSIPTAAFVPEGFGTTFTGALVVVLNPFFVAPGLGVALLVVFGDGVADFEFDGIDFPSITVTLIFCPGFKFSMPTFDEESVVFGLIVTFLLEVGVGMGDAFGEGEVFGAALSVGFGEAAGFSVTEGLGDGAGEGDFVADGEGDGAGEGFAVGVGDALGLGVGVTEGEGDGVGVGVGVGVGASGTEPPPLGAGELGLGETFATCSGITAVDA